MENLVKTLIIPLENFNNLFADLHNKMGLVSSDKEKNAKLSELISNFGPLLENIQTFKKKESKDCFYIFHSVEEMSKGIKDVLDYLEKNYAKSKLDNYITQTSYSDFSEIEEKIFANFRLFEKKKEKVYGELYAVMYENIKEEMKPREIQKYFREWPESVDFYVFVMQNLLEQRSAYERIEIHKLISEDKEWALKTTKVKAEDDEPFMSSFGLVAATPARTLAELAKTLGLAGDIQTVDSFAKHYASYGVDFAVIETVTNRPILYNSIGLMGKTINLKQGLNTELVSLLLTILPGKVSKWSFKITKKEVPNSEKMLVLQKVAESSFKILTNYIGAPGPIYKISLDLTDRRDKYNAAIIDMAKNEMFTLIKHSTESFEKKSDIVDPKFLINDIFLAITEKFEKNQKNRVNLKTLFTDSAYTEIYTNKLEKEFHEYFRKNLYMINIDKINISDVFVSFRYHLKLYQRNFSKDIYDSFTSKIEQIKSDPQKLFEEVIMTLLKKYISPESNIYKDMYMKILTMKLNIT